MPTCFCTCGIACLHVLCWHVCLVPFWHACSEKPVEQSSVCQPFLVHPLCCTCCFSCVSRGACPRAYLLVAAPAASRTCYVFTCARLCRGLAPAIPITLTADHLSHCRAPLPLPTTSPAADHLSHCRPPLPLPTTSLTAECHCQGEFQVVWMPYGQAATALALIALISRLALACVPPCTAPRSALQRCYHPQQVSRSRALLLRTAGAAVRSHQQVWRALRRLGACHVCAYLPH